METGVHAYTKAASELPGAATTRPTSTTIPANTRPSPFIAAPFLGVSIPRRWRGPFRGFRNAPDPDPERPGGGTGWTDSLQGRVRSGSEWGSRVAASYHRPGRGPNFTDGRRLTAPRFRDWARAGTLLRNLGPGRSVHGNGRACTALDLPGQRGRGAWRC